MGTKKIVGKIFAFIFTTVFAILCLSFVYVFMIRNIATYEHVSSYVSDANIFDCSSFEVLPRKDASTLREAIGKDLFEIGVPRLVVDDILDSDEVHKIITDYTYGYIRYIIYNEKKPIFPDEDFIKIVENKYYLSQKKGLSEDQKTEITKYVIEFSSKLDKGTFDKSELNEIINMDTVRLLLTSVSSKLAVIVLSAVLLVMVSLICICLHSFAKGIRWCSKAVLVDGIFLIVTSLLEVKVLMMFVDSKGIVDSLFIAVINNQFGSLVTCGIVFVALGILFLVITGVLLNKQHKKNSDAILNDVIATEVNESASEIANKVVSEPVAEVAEEKAEEVPVEETKTEPEEPVSDNMGIADVVSAESPIQTEEMAKEPVNTSEGETKEVEPEEVNPIVMTDEVPVEDIPKDEEKSDDNSFDLMEIVDVQEDMSAEVSDNTENEKEMEVAIETPIAAEETNSVSNSESNDYTEISDEEEIVKEDIKISEPTNIELNVIHPVKGRDIEVTEEEEEEIEIL